jgi:predicted 2-oxoglutarate/Fe(II)-dependent dioxygenase YbiX
LKTSSNEHSSQTQTLTSLQERKYSPNDYTSLIPFEDGHLLHKTNQQIFTSTECQTIINEAEYIASQMGWTTKRHGNYPTTDIPLVELPNTMQFLRKALVERIYPLLRIQFASYFPSTSDAPYRLRVADGFIVKYDAEGGQSELKPHRDGSVFSFNIALNSALEFDGGGTWFESLGEAVRIDQGEMVSHASGVLHGGHGITRGKRYIVVAFVILEGYDGWSMRFYNKVRNM